MPKTEAYNNAQAAQLMDISKITNALSNIAPGGSAVNKQLAQNANAAYDIGQNVVSTGANTITNIGDVITFLFNNWQLTIIGALALLLIIKRI